MVVNEFWALLLGVQNEAWNKTRIKYMKVKRRQNLAETDKGSYYKEKWLEEFLNSKGAFNNGNQSDNNDESYNEIMNSGSYLRVLPIVAKLTILPSASTILLLVEDASHGFEN